MMDCLDSSPISKRPQWLRLLRAGAAVLGFALAAALGEGCGGRAPARDSSPRPAQQAGSTRLAVDVLADTGRSEVLTATRPAVSIDVSRVSRVAPARTGVVEPPLPPAAPDSVPQPETRSPSEPATLLPPILRRPARVVPPAGLDHTVTIELEVRVDVQGRVVDVQWASGAQDSALVLAARRCAATMEFYPALYAGKPVEVWCRQRFEFTPR